MKDLLLAYLAVCYFVVPFTICAGPKWQALQLKRRGAIARIAVQVLLLAWPFILLRGAMRCDYPRSTDHG